MWLQAGRNSFPYHKLRDRSRMIMISRPFCWWTLRALHLSKLTRSTQRHRQHPLNPLRSSTAISLTVNFITREMGLCKDLSELSRRATINHPYHPDQQAARHSTEADTLRFFLSWKTSSKLYRPGSIPPSWQEFFTFFTYLISGWVKN